MQTTLINNTIYVLNENIVSIKKQTGTYSNGKEWYKILIEYINGTKKREYFKSKEELEFAFDRIDAIMRLL